jgi:hypothetical protein
MAAATVSLRETLIGALASLVALVVTSQIVETLATVGNGGHFLPLDLPRNCMN